VTRAGESDLDEPIAVRPTSETIMYPAYSKWIRSHRDLPLKLNQWSNVVRWEFKNPTPFIRSREFLWQEGHSAFATKEEADEEVRQILQLYASVYQELLAVPVVMGKKTDKEKFAGGLYTTTTEAYIPGTGRGIQGATSHCLGQNFARMFKIEFENNKGEKGCLVWQNSWGLTTRTIGVMVMVHSDDKGLVLPPRVAPTQCILIPIFFSSDEQTKVDAVKDETQRVREILKKLGVRTEVDARETYTPGWKFNHWELKGVPLRVEIGPKDIDNKQITVVRRDTGQKTFIKLANLDQIPRLLDTIQRDMFDRALSTQKSHTATVSTWHEFMVHLDERKIILAPWCGQTECEEKIKGDSAQGEKKGEKELTGAAKSLCIPFDQPSLPSNAKCVRCPHPATTYCLFGRSY